MQIMGHRGAAGVAPENTLPSFQKALDIGVDWVEFDVHSTLDGKIVVIHNKNTKRTSKQKFTVKNTPLMTLQQLETKSGHRIPTFTEVVLLIGDRAKINIEVKSMGCADEISATIKKLVAAGYSYDNFLVSSFYPKLLGEVRSKNKHINLGLIHWIMPFKFLVLADKLDLSAVGFHQFNTTPQLINMAKKRNLFTYVYTVNSAKGANRYKKWGADAVVTDHPERMIKHDRKTLLGI